MPSVATLSSKNQVVIPQEACQKLHLESGHKLLVLTKEDRIVMIPKPDNPVEKLAGLHKEIWDDVDAEAYLCRERESWKD